MTVRDSERRFGSERAEADRASALDRFLDRRTSRQEFMRGALAAGAAFSVGGVLGACDTGGDEPEEVGPSRGGRLRMALAGGGSSETLDPNHQKEEMDTARYFCLFERLVDLDPDGKQVNQLAQELTPNADGSVWKVRVQPDVVFHDGKPLTAQDIVYTFQHILDPSTTSTGRPLFSTLFRAQDVRALDRTTVEFRLRRPSAILPEQFTSQQYGIFPEGTKSFDRPIGTGPWKFKSWTRGERSLFVRFDQYREHDGPYLDEVEIISIDDPSARLNALSSGEVEAVPRLEGSVVSQVENNPSLKLLGGPTGVHTDFTMQVDSEPFTDNRVRQAFRLMIDRDQMISNALNGRGKIGNDLPTPFDPNYASDIPQREHDPEQARALLKQAGHSNPTVTLRTSSVGPGMLESATLFAEQAAAAGVKVKINRVTEDQFYEDPFLKTPFSQDTWSFRTLANMMADGYVSASPFNETHWKRPRFDRLVQEANTTLDEAKRKEIWAEAQQMLWDEGGFIIWGFIDNADGISAKLRGVPSAVTRPLGRYRFNDAFLA
jgi:peptide/nickel transport system substrate-binding protein